MLVDNGIPDYDVAAGVTTWRTLPVFDAQSVQVRDQSQAFRYGDMAAGGTFFVSTQPQSRFSAVAGGGSQGELVLDDTAGLGSYGFAIANDGVEVRKRADGSFRIPVGDDAFPLPRSWRATISRRITRAAS